MFPTKNTKDSSSSSADSYPYRITNKGEGRRLNPQTYNWTRQTYGEHDLNTPYPQPPPPTPTMAPRSGSPEAEYIPLPTGIPVTEAPLQVYRQYLNDLNRLIELGPEILKVKICSGELYGNELIRHCVALNYLFTPAGISLWENKQLYMSAFKDSLTPEFDLTNDTWRKPDFEAPHLSAHPQSDISPVASSPKESQRQRHNKRLPNIRKPVSALVGIVGPPPSVMPLGNGYDNASHESLSCAFTRFNRSGTSLGRCGEVVPRELEAVRKHMSPHIKLIDARGPDSVVCPFCSELPGVKDREIQHRELSKHITDVHYKARGFHCLCGGKVVRGDRNSIDRHNKTEKHRSWECNMKRKSNGSDDDDQDEGSSKGTKRRRRD